MGRVHDSLKKISLFHQLSGGAAGDKAAKDALHASHVAAKGQQEAMDYLKQRGMLPNELRDAALKELGGIYGLPGFDKFDLTGQSMDSPLYKAMTGQIDQSLADESQQAGATASAKGQLGSGILVDALAKYRARSGVDKANALGQVYQQQLSGIGNLSNEQGYDPQIANLMQSIAATKAQGITASDAIAVDTQRNKFGALGSTLGSIFGMGGGGQQQSAMPIQGNQYGGAAYGQGQGVYPVQQQNYNSNYAGGTENYFSDVRLKDNVEYVCRVDGHNWYKWKWNDEAKKLGLHGDDEGVMAHEVEHYLPEAIGEKDGYMTINYSKLGAH